MPSLIKSVNAAVHKLHLKSAKSTPDIDDASAFDPVWAKLEWDQWADLPGHLRTQNGPAPAASIASSTTSLPTGRSSGSPLTQPTSQAGVKKKRVPACDTCNSKKIKCDGVRPNCGMCSKNGRTCSYERLAESNRGKRPRTDDASDVVQNPSTPMNPAAVAQAVAVVPPAVQPSQHRSPATQQSFPNLMPSALQLVGQSHFPSSQSVQANVPILNSSIGNASTYQNQQAAASSRIAPFAVLPSSRIGTTASQIMAAQQNTPSRPNHIQVGSVSSASNVLLRGVQNSISQSNFNSLPAALVHANQYPLTKPPDPLATLPQEAKNDLIGLYFKYIDPMMPILHKQSFHNSKEAESPLLLHTIYAMAARYCKQPAVLAIGALYGSSANGSASTTMEELRSRACDAFYFKARDLVDQYMDFPRVSTIAAFCSGRVSASWMYSGMAISMLKDLRRTNAVEDDLGATLDALADADGTGAGHGVEWLEREKRRRLWWSCYVGDRYAAAASDRPMILVDTDCKVHFPSNINDWDAGRPVDRETPLSLDLKQRHTLDFASSNAFVPFTTPQPPRSYFLILCKLFGRIIDFTKVYKTATTHPPTAQHRPLTSPADFNKPEIDQHMQILDSSLNSWSRLLPESLALSNSLVGAELSHFSSPAKSLSDVDTDKNLKDHLHLFYHICHILVHKPKLMHMLRVLPSSQHHSSIPLQDSFRKSLFHATQITQLLARVRTTNPHLLHFTPFITCFAIFQSALVHLIRGQVSCHNADADRSCQDALLHADALKGFSRDWGIAVKLCGSLLTLIEAAKEEAVKNSGAKIICEACVSRGVVTDSSAWQAGSRQALQQPPSIQSSQPHLQQQQSRVQQPLQQPQQQYLQQHQMQQQQQQQYQQQLQPLPLQQGAQQSQQSQFQMPFQNYSFQNQLPLQQPQVQHQQIPVNRGATLNSSGKHQRQISEEVIELHRRDAQFLSHGSLNANNISSVPTLGSSTSTSSVNGINNWLAGIPDVSRMNHVGGNFDATTGRGFDVGAGGGGGAVQGVAGLNGAAPQQERQVGVGGISDIWNLQYLDSASFDMNPGAGSQFFQ
ncbi:hypothetical protein HDU77_004181 [Chytriomyces hyalinus]|nr:hypothetical protein HDU77_004181 [Chytriomyces hyalinus]